MVLFDHNIPKRLRRFLAGHFVRTSTELGWDTLKNGDLIDAGEAAGFEVLVTGDKNLSYQQNLDGRKLALIVLDTTNWNLLKPDPSPVVMALDHAAPGTFQRVSFKKPAGAPPS